jgi:hypothetical protein
VDLLDLLDALGLGIYETQVVHCDRFDLEFGAAWLNPSVVAATELGVYHPLI